MKKGTVKYPIITGERFGRLVVLHETPKRPSNAGRRVLCQCDCDFNKTIDVLFSALHSGNTRSCGCLHKEQLREMATTHGHNRPGKRTHVYGAYNAMKQRCENTNHLKYKDYGGRGIKVCERWLNSFEDFLADMGEPPSDKHTLDRFPDMNGNYEPGNVRWATAKEQCNNKRNNRLLTFNGETKTMTEWANQFGISDVTILKRLKRGWSVEKAITIPSRPTKRSSCEEGEVT